ncbi:MAG: hypothetical protein HND27_04245 [Bacteroidetes bacterium]|nr:hypothetical protein [Bacteroidota bacterium]MBV6460293.1 hypothetical protein [Flavobacteriales bacterium]WKZ74661.1 MAG: hypothetical protein QY303_10980 [Vicingaceae bacterium]MCL4815841.1 hypothetical protein [Flavobacteriales bacterium]NOG94968.1 hypothetical protein [Bacteroidota bacterium]
MRFFSFLVTTLLTLPLSAQPVSIQEIPVQTESFTTDHLGNLYTIEKNHIVKYNKNGEKLYFFSTNKYGNVTGLDVSNPYKILVFFSDFSTLLFLDNTLSLNGEPINMQQQGMEMTALAASSYQNGIWLYDALQFRLIRLNENLSVTVNTPNLVQTTGINLQPTFMQEYNNLLFVNNPESGILVFDIFGAYIKTIPILQIKKFQPIENEILYVKENRFYRYHLKTLDIISEPLEKNSIDCRLEKQRKYLLTTQSVLLFNTSDNP